MTKGSAMGLSRLKDADFAFSFSMHVLARDATYFRIGLDLSVKLSIHAPAGDATFGRVDDGYI